MVLALFLGISWLMVMIYLTFPRQLDRRESALLFMLIMDLHISVSWLFVFEAKKVEVAETVPEYLAYLVHRSVLVPMVALLILNLLKFRWSVGIKTLLWLLFGVVMTVLEKLCTTFDVFKFHGWSYWKSLLMYYPYLLAAYFVLKWYRACIDKEVKVR